MTTITREINNNRPTLFTCVQENQSSRKRHTKEDKDHMTRKIKTFVFNSIITFINQIIDSYFTKQIRKLRKVKSKYNRKLSKELNKKLFKLKIRTLLYKSVSPKYREKFKDQNRTNIDSLEKYSFFKNLFQIKYWKFYTYLFLFDNYEIINKCFSTEDEKIKDNIMKIKMNNLKQFLKKHCKDEKYNERLCGFAKELKNEFRLQFIKKKGTSNQSTNINSENSIQHKHFKVKENELDFNEHLYDGIFDNINNFSNN